MKTPRERNPVVSTGGLNTSPSASGTSPEALSSRSLGSSPEALAWSRRASAPRTRHLPSAISGFSFRARPTSAWRDQGAEGGAGADSGPEANPGCPDRASATSQDGGRTGIATAR